MTTPPDLDSLPDLQMAILTQIDNIPEVTCEEPHHPAAVTCSIEVAWSAPGHPCGCVLRRLVCRSLHDWVMRAPLNIRCTSCGYSTHPVEWRTGWYPV